MPGPRAAQNLQMPHPQDWQGKQMPNSRYFSTSEDFKKVVRFLYTNTYWLFVWNIAERALIEWSKGKK